MKINDVVCKEVIITNIERRGDGKTRPMRIITLVHEKDGTKIAEHDPAPDTYTDREVIAFAKWCKDDGWDFDRLTVDALEKWELWKERKESELSSLI